MVYALGKPPERCQKAGCGSGAPHVLTGLGERDCAAHAPDMDDARRLVRLRLEP